MAPLRAIRIALVLGLFIAGGCRCGSEGVISAERCRGIEGVEEGRWEPCGEGDACGNHYACSPVDGRPELSCCLFADRKCDTEADCCPGQTCPADKKKCFDRYLECATDADCSASGDRVCEVWTDAYGTSSRCRPRRCGGGRDCADGQYCFNGECVASLPCGGRCDPGKACVPAIDRCQSFSCPTTCAPGFIATFRDNQNLWDTCDLGAVACTCAELPPLRSFDLGRFSAMAVDARERAVFVSHYDGEYGDLVVDRYGPDGNLAGREYVDGVPEGKPVKYGASGPRGGVVDPGEDVGRYTDIAAAGGHLYVSYYDATNGDLKLAVRAPNGRWKRVKVDGADADVGLYTSIAVDAGRPIISYFQRGGSERFDPATCPGGAPGGDPRLISALKVARAQNSNPEASDFTVLTLACESRPAPACFGCQGICADPGTGPGCYTPSTACSGCDPGSHACIVVGGASTCAPRHVVSALTEIPDGVGLFSSIAMRGGDAYLVYMRRSRGKGELVGARLPPNGTSISPVILDASGDTGYFPTLSVEPSSHALAIAWHDFASHKLKFLSVPELASGVPPAIIDSGGASPGSGKANWVGADVALAWSPSGVLYAAYQDSTQGDLKLASRAASSWTVLSPVRAEGAVGFFADAAFLGDTLFLSHARIRARLVSGEPRVDNALLVERVTAP